MRKNLVLLLVGVLLGGLAASVVPAAADDQSGRASVGQPVVVRADTEEAASLTTSEAPPRPFMRSHGVRIRAARVGYCTREQVETEPGCAVADVFLSTRPLPLHPRGHVFVNTRVDADHLDVRVHCGSPDPVWQLGPRRWVFHVGRKQATDKHCLGGSLTATYAEGTEFAGGVGEYTFSTKPHRH